MVESLSYLRAYEAEHLVPRHAPESFARQDFTSHVRRHAVTLALLRHLGRALTARLGRAPRILDVGGDSFLRDVLSLELPDIQGTRGDLRGRFSRGAHSAYELIICTEVVEHITDPQVGFVGDGARDFNAEVQLSGVSHCLGRLSEALAPDGVLLLTTPNCLSLHVMRRLAERVPPAVYRPHHRELSPSELSALLRGAGLSPLVGNLQFYLANYDLSGELELLQRTSPGKVPASLGDTLVAFARRAEAPKEVAPLRRYLEVLARATAPDFMVAYLGLSNVVADVLE